MFGDSRGTPMRFNSSGLIWFQSSVISKSNPLPESLMAISQKLADEC